MDRQHLRSNSQRPSPEGKRLQLRGASRSGLRLGGRATPLPDLYLLAAPPGPLLNARFGDGRPTVLHVDQLAPNKRIGDLIKAQWLARLASGARLLLVGEGETTAYALGFRKLALEFDVLGVPFGATTSATLR